MMFALQRKMMCLRNDVPLRGNGGGRFKMPSALLWAVLAEKLFQERNAGRSADRPALHFHGKRFGRQAAAAVPVLMENIAALFFAPFIMKEIHLTKQLC